MMARRMVCYLAVLAACVSLIVAGCEAAPKELAKPAEEQAKPAVQGPAAVLALAFQPQDSTRYRIVREMDRGYIFNQPSEEKYTEEHTGSRIELTVTERIEAVDDQGSATARVTIEQMKYSGRIKNTVNIDFDSTREGDKSSELAKLIGESYKIKIAPDGKAELIDAAQLYSAVTGTSPESKLAVKLFSAERIPDLHTILALPDAKENKLRPGQSWTRIKASPPGMLEPKSYEKTYTLEQVRQCNGQSLAVVKMSAVPTDQVAEDIPQGAEGMGAFAKMFDSSDLYNGELLLNLGTGKLSQYSEKLESQWIASEKPRGAKPDSAPDVLTMSVTSLHSIEMLD